MAKKRTKIQLNCQLSFTWGWRQLQNCMMSSSNVSSQQLSALEKLFWRTLKTRHHPLQATATDQDHSRHTAVNWRWPVILVTRSTARKHQRYQAVKQIWRGRLVSSTAAVSNETFIWDLWNSFYIQCERMTTFVGKIIEVAVNLTLPVLYCTRFIATEVRRNSDVQIDRQTWV